MNSKPWEIEPSVLRLISKIPNMRSRSKCCNEYVSLKNMTWNLVNRINFVRSETRELESCLLDEYASSKTSGTKPSVDDEYVSSKTLWTKPSVDDEYASSKTSGTKPSVDEYANSKTSGTKPSVDDEYVKSKIRTLESSL